MDTNNNLMFQIEIPIVNYDTCQEAYAPLKKKVTKDMICAGEKEGKKLTKIYVLGTWDGGGDGGRGKEVEG